MKAYSYLRFSTPEQLKGDSTRRQLERTKKWAEEHGLELDDKLTYEDMGVSGFRGQNVATGALSVFLEALGRGDIEKGSYLLVENLDRLTRDLIVEAQYLFISLIRQGITIVTLMDGKEYSRESLNAQPTDMFLSIITMIRANQESAVKSDRIKSVWENKRSKMSPQQAVLARLPAWLQFDRTTNKFRVIEERADVVRRVFGMAATGCGIANIVRVLNQEGIPTFGTGKMWYPSFVALLLGNPSVVGDFTPHVMEHVEGKKSKKPQRMIPDYYPCIIDRDLFAQVRALIDGKTGVQARRRSEVTVKNIFSGLAKCPICGGTMNHLNKGKRNYTYMACAKGRLGAGCEYKAVRYEKIEQAFVEGTHKLVIPIGEAHLDARWEKLAGELTVLQDYLVELLEGAAGKAMPKGVKEKLINDVKLQMADLEAQVTAMEPEIASRRERLTDLNIGRMREACQEVPLDRAKLNTVLRQVLNGVVVDYRSGDLVLEWKHGGESELMYESPFKDESRTG